MRTIICFFIVVSISIYFFSNEASAATFSIEEEDGGPLCWITTKSSNTETLSLFTEKDGGTNKIEFIIGDTEKSDTDYGTFEKTFDISFYFGNGDKLSYPGRIGDYFSLPYAEVKMNLLEKLLNQSKWQILIGNMNPIVFEDIILNSLYRQFIACASKK